MAQVRFNLRPNKDKHPSIQLIYRMDADRVKLVIGTKLNVPERFWNKSTMRVRQTSDYIDHVQVNTILNMWETAANESIKDFKLKKETPTRIQLKESILHRMKPSERRSNKNDISTFFADFITRKKNASKSPLTIKVYQNTLNHYNKFRETQLHNRVLEFSDFDAAMFIKFRVYLQSFLEENTVHKVVRKFRSMLNDAASKGHDVPSSYKDRDIQVSYIKQPKYYLNNDEISQIKNAKLKGNERLDRVRDLLLVGLYTGLRISDFMRVTNKMITKVGERKVIKIRTEKTDNIVTIPLHKEVENILKKHKGKLPRISDQKFNEYIKELCNVAKIHTMIPKVINNKQIMLRKCDIITSHICRRSFATNGYKAGVSPLLLLKVTGHSSLKQFMDYVCIDEEESLDMMMQHEYFK